MSPRLAVDGGTPVRTTPLPPWPFIAEDEIEAAARVLRSGYINYSIGREGVPFEREFADFVGARHALALANGTLALELALDVLGVGPGDEVITTSRTFIASAACAATRGARPVCVDVDPDSQNLTAAAVEAAITPRTRAIVAVHLAGWPCEMDALMDLAERHGLRLIEDCAQAHGATYKGRGVGSIGHVAAFSFCQDKIITTGGEGGMLTTNDTALWKKAWAYKDQGKGYDLVHGPAPAGPGPRRLHEVFGSNMRLTEMQSAMGRLALGKLAGWVATRRRHAGTLAARLGALPGLRVPVPADHLGHAYYKFYAFVRPERLKAGWDRDRVMAAIAAEGIPCTTGSQPEIYLEPAFPPEWRPAERLPVAKALGETCLMFLVHPTLTDADVADAAAAVEKVMAEATA